MYRLDWDDRLLTGDERVDSQHRAIFMLLRDTVVILEEGGDRDRVGDALYELLRYVGVHFGDEEALMRRIGFPGIDRQRRLHADFRRKAGEMAEVYLADGPVDAQTLLLALIEWVNHHVVEEDGKIAEHIRAAGSYSL